MTLPRAFLLLLLLPATTSAQTSTVPLSHWQHSAWTGEKSPALPVGRSMLRSSDGYLWLGSFRGLVRFDGVRFTLIDSSYTPLLRPRPGQDYNPVTLDRTGRMWVTGPTGVLLSYSAGEFRREWEDTGRVHGVAEYADGQIWLAVDSRLHLLRDGRLEAAPIPREVPDTGILGILTDNAGGIWIGTLADGLWHVTGGSARHYGSGKLFPVLQSTDGTLWLTKDYGPDRGIMRLRNGTFTRVMRPDRPESITAGIAVEGPDGSIWLPSFSAGLFRWHDGVVEQFSARDGLSSNTMKSAFVGSEGAVWMATDAGVDRLRPAAFVPVELRDGLPDEAPASFAIATDGTLWSATREGTLYQSDGGIIRRRAGPVTAESHPLPGTQSRILEILTPSRRGGIWMSNTLRNGLVYYHNGRVEQRFDQRNGLPPERPWSAAEGPDGTVWVRFFPQGFGFLRHGVYHSLPGRRQPAPQSMVPDVHGQLWFISAVEMAVVKVAGDSLLQRISLPDSAPGVYSLVRERGDTLWAMGPRGVYRVADGRVAEVRVPAAARILEAAPRMAITHDRLWLSSESGIAAIPLADLHRAADGDTTSIVPVDFDQLDGLVTPRSKSSTLRPLQVGPDGRLWIATPTGFAVSDDSPRAINRVPPMVHVEEVTLAGKRVSLPDGGTLQPNPERLAVRFSAPSLGLPERVRVEYRLDGADKEWIDSKPPWIANYDHLRPGHYQFQVRAWNESGTPSATSANLSFVVLPAWYQSNWFLTLCIVAIALLGALLAHLLSRARHRRAAAAVEVRYEAVLAERTRLARELHDTLLQGFTGLTLQIDGVRAALQEQNEEQSAALSSILERADHTLRDAREMVWDMRKTHDSGDLGQALREDGDTLANPQGVKLEYVVTGAPRTLAPTVVATLLRIAREATVNALNHARATKIVVTLAYDAQGVALEVQDDGCGADLQRVETAPTRGHWGVAGMRERARSVGAALSMNALPGKGTRVGVQVMAPPDQRPVQTS